MKKKILSILTAAACCLSLAGCNGNTSGTSTPANSTPASTPANSTPADSGTASNETIDLRVWGPEEDQALLVELTNDFKAAHPDQTFNIEIGVQSEAQTKDTVLTDISAAADVYAYASDQLNELVNAGALAKLDDLNDALVNISGKSIDDIKAANTEGSVKACTKNDALYSFPLGAGNNIFMFYDSKVINEKDVETWDSLLEAAGNASKKVGMTLATGWYNGGFFLGSGFTASMNDDGTTNIDWNGTSSTGIKGTDVVEGIINIASHPAFMAVNEGDNANQIAAGSLCAIVTGSWDVSAVQAAWGDDFGVAKLPTFTVAGQQVQQGCFSSFKNMGVNAMSKQLGWAAVLAEFLTNEENQIKRYDARQLAPTNINAGSNEKVTADKVVSASVAQDTVAGFIQDVGSNYWSPTQTFGAMIALGELKSGDTEGIQKALDTMVEGVTAPLT